MVSIRKEDKAGERGYMVFTPEVTPTIGLITTPLIFIYNGERRDSKIIALISPTSTNQKVLYQSF